MRRRRYKARATLPPASPSKAPLFTRHLLQSPASPYSLTPDFFSPPPPPTLPSQTGLPGKLKRSRSHLALPSWPGFSPPLLPGPHTTHSIFTSMDVPTTQAQTSSGRTPLPPPVCPQPSSSGREFESRGGQGSAGVCERVTMDHLYLPANPSPIAKINPSLCEPERASHHAGPRSAAAVKRGGGGGWDPNPFLGELGAPRPPDHRAVLRGKKALMAGAADGAKRERRCPSLRLLYYWRHF